MIVAVLLGVTACGDTSVRFCTGGPAFCASFGNSNRSPNADAGADQNVVSGDLVQLDGSRSSDPDGRIESYAWVQTDGIAVALINANRAVASFRAPDVPDMANLDFELTVIDDRNASDRDQTRVSVAAPVLAALEAGLMLLETRVVPKTLDGAVPVSCAVSALPAEDPDASVFVGLWLMARIHHVEIGAEEVRTGRLLDAMRRLAEDLPGPSGPNWQATLYGHGVAAAVRFSRDRDPALSATLDRLLAEFDAPDPRIIDRLAEGRLVLSRDAHGALEMGEGGVEQVRRQAVEVLLGANCAVEPDAVLAAAATVTLVCQSSGALPGSLEGC